MEKNKIAGLYKPLIDNFDINKLKVSDRKRKEFTYENGTKATYYTVEVTYDGKPISIKF